MAGNLMEEEQRILQSLPVFFQGIMHAVATRDILTEGRSFIDRDSVILSEEQ